VRTCFATFNYTLGFALTAASSPTESSRKAAVGFTGVDPDSVPLAVQVAPFLSHFVDTGMSASDEQFSFGLDLILDSVVRRLRRESQPNATEEGVTNGVAHCSRARADAG